MVAEAKFGLSPPQSNPGREGLPLKLATVPGSPVFPPSPSEIVTKNPEGILVIDWVKMEKFLGDQLKVT